MRGIGQLRVEPDPDFGRLLAVMGRGPRPDRVPFFEIHGQIEGAVLARLGAEPFAPNEAETPRRNKERALEAHFRYMRLLGYDYVNIIPEIRFPGPASWTRNAAGRLFVGSDNHCIETHADAETYPWPDLAAVDFSFLDWARDKLPAGMKVVIHNEGPYIKALYLLGYEGLALSACDDPGLVEEVAARVGQRMVEYFDRCAAHETVGALMLADDIGYRTGTYLAPKTLREFFFPWWRKIVDAVHARGKPIMLHACGNIEAVMADVIDMGFDARHSFEDAITPVWEAKQKWGDRIGLLGGFDMDRLCRATPDEVRAHTRLLNERCAAGGRWALGTGNSVASYVPPDNFLAMLEEGHLAGRYA